MALRRRSWLILGAVPVIVIAVALIANHRARLSPKCTPPNEVEAHRFPDDLPESLKQDLLHFGPITPPDEYFCATDVCHGEHWLRAAFLWSHQARWVLALERGGRGYAIEVYAYNIAADGSLTTTATPQPAGKSEICEFAERALYMR